MDRVGAPRRRGILGIPGVAFVAAVLVIAVVVNAAVIAVQPATVTPTTITPLPVTMAGGTSTTVTSGTSASTSGISSLVVIPTTTLTLARQAPNDWNVVLAVTSASGISGLEGMVLAIVGGGTLTLDPSDTYPQATAASALDADGLTITYATVAVFGCHTCTVTAEIRITPASGTLPTFVYPWTITTAA